MENPLVLPTPHTLKSIADECGVGKDKAKYAYRKLGQELGRVIDGTRYFSEDEATSIIVAGGFQRKADVVTAEIIDPGDPLAHFDPLAITQGGNTYTPADDTQVIDLGNQALAKLQERSTANHNAGLQALIQHRRNRGRKLGAMLAQVEIGTALQESDRLVTDFFEQQGVTVGPAGVSSASPQS